MRLFTFKNSVREQNFGDLDSYFFQYTTVQEIIYIIGCEEGYSLRRDACLCMSERECVRACLFIIEQTSYLKQRLYYYWTATTALKLNQQPI